MKKAVSAIVLLLGLVIFSSVAEAQVPRIMQMPRTRPFWVSGYIGPAVNLRSNFVGTQIKLVEQFGFHFTRRPWGPAIAFELQESISNNDFTFEVLPRFIWDIPISKKLGLLLSPSVGIGYSYQHLGPGHIYQFQGVNYPIAGSVSGFTVQLAFEGKLLLGRRGLIIFRPFGLDIQASDFSWPVGWDTTVRWDMLLGGGMVF